MSTRGALSTARARLRSDERGFSLIEVMVAITVIFGALTALAYTATIGFDHIGYARERQQGTGLANQLMEEVRGLAYERIQQGLLTTDVAADPRAVTGCSGDAAGVYRYETCAGEKIVHSSGLSPASPLVPNNGTISSGFPTPYQYRVYVTNDDPGVDPYRVTVVVSWASRRFSTTANEVQTQTLIFSPSGCVSTTTHPFQAPCQPFFFGQALVPRPTFTVSGTVEALSAFDSAVFHGPSVEANVQIEQVAQVQTSVQTSGVERTVSGTLTQAAGARTSRTADNDPSTATGEYSVNTSVSGAAGSLSHGAGSNTLVVSNGGAGDAGSVASAVAASATAPCPPSATESDSQPCGHASGRQQNTASAVLTLGEVKDVNLGSTTLARMQAPGASSPSTAFSDRELGVGGADGRLEQSANRVLGTVNIGGLPSVMTAPANWNGANAWNGYLVSLVGYQDSASAQAGTSAPAPSASRSGTIHYWNGTGYTSVAVGSAGTLNLSVSLAQVIDGENVTVSLSGTTAPASNITSSTPSGGGSITRNEVRAEAGSPLVGSFTYTIAVNGETVVDLSVAVSLGNLLARGTYEPAPSP